jgi:hypothetical protein
MRTNGKHEVIARIAGPGLVLGAVFALVLSGSSVVRAQASAASAAVPAATPAKAAPQAQPAAAVPGAPAMGFKAPATASAPAKPVVQAAPATPGPRLDPITHGPISTLATRGPEATEASLNEADSPLSVLASDGSLQQGLKVHGHWVINVRNPDGTLVQHREFDNSIENSAQGFMVGLLSGYMIPGDWMIVLGAQSGAGPCNGPTYQFCGFVHNLNTYPALGYCGVYYCTGSTLSYTYNFGTGFAGPFSIVLNGTITSNQTGTVGTVFTLISECANIGYSSTTNPSSIETSSPATCVTQTTPQPWYGPFTDTNITPVAITSGQLIQVIVTITFS